MIDQPPEATPRESAAVEMETGSLDEHLPEPPFPRRAAVTVDELAFLDLRPRSGERRVELGFSASAAVPSKLAKVDLLDRRIGAQECRAGVERDRFDQGITWPPSSTIACPVRFRASSEAM